MEESNSTTITFDLDFISHFDIPNLNLSLIPKTGEAFYVTSSQPIMIDEQKVKSKKRKRK